MNTFNNFKIVYRLIFIIGLLFLATLAMLSVAFLGFRTAKTSTLKMYNGGIDDIWMLYEIKDTLKTSTVDLEDRIRAGLGFDEAIASAKAGEAKIHDLWDKYLEDAKSFDKDDTALNYLKPFQDILKEANQAFDQFQLVMHHRDKDQLTNFLLTELYPLKDDFTTKIDQLIRAHINDTHSDFKELMGNLEEYEKNMLIVFALAWAIALLLSLLIAYWIARPITNSVEIIKKVASGDTSEDIKSTTQDEVGHLLKAMHAMVVSSRNMGDTLAIIASGDLTVAFEPRSSKDTLGHAIVILTEKLKRIVVDLQTEVNTLTQSAGEIVNSVSEVAVNSTTTANAVNETATTMEELKQTAYLSSEKANNVLNNAEENLIIVKASEKALETTLEDMGEINERMGVISAGIVKLSDYGKSIRAIIDSVNDLAEQSNLLAVNAAIEAAKAGEHGKTFGVVAQEIRNLSEQSKMATVKVKSILNDIQNATNSTVLATEQGARAAEKGLAQSKQTMESLHALMTSIATVAQSANQIALTSKQQLVGIDQVAGAMNNIGDATNRHVEHMKHIEAAVLSLNSVSLCLKEIVDRYKLHTQRKPKKETYLEKELVTTR